MPLNNNNLRNFIKNLAGSDKKTLSQKALKLTEETGELAKVVLPFDNASGTLHRFTDKAQITEAVADVILCALSVTDSMGVDDQELETMLYDKAIKWQKIQTGEEAIDPDKIPFEIHITIACPTAILDDNNYWINRFREHCKVLGVKPIILDLTRREGEGLTDVMTSSKFVGTNAEAYRECKRIAKGISVFAPVLREKIETVPWHPASPKEPSDIMPENCYFEAHIGCLVKNEDDEELLSKIAETEDCHLSKNYFKKNDDGSYTKMITTRWHSGTADQFNTMVAILSSILTRAGFKYEKVITEFSIYDTKVSHDFAWTNQEVGA